MFEDNLGQALFSGNSEKSFIDKVLAKSDVENVRDLVRKEKLTRSDMLSLLYMLSGNEAKLWNYGEWDRYILAKYFVWIREFVKVAELLYDYTDDLTTKKAEGKSTMSPRAEQLLSNNQRLIEHNVKFLVDLYFNLARTTLSLGATGILELVRNKYEFSYPQGQNVTGSNASEPSGRGRV